MLLPETAYVEFAQFSEEDDLYTLSHVPQITRDELDQALQQAGWAARAIKPQGSHCLQTGTEGCSSFGNKWLHRYH
eukprot:Skav227093  [mRNA]  locus=scaffold1387:440986:441213:- [translate_table: standard]